MGWLSEFSSYLYKAKDDESYLRRYLSFQRDLRANRDSQWAPWAVLIIPIVLLLEVVLICNALLPPPEPGIDDRSFFALGFLLFLGAPVYLILALSSIFTLVILHIRKRRIQKELLTIHPDIAKLYAKEIARGGITDRLERARKNQRQYLYLIMIGGLVCFLSRGYLLGFTKYKPDDIQLLKIWVSLIATPLLLLWSITSGYRQILQRQLASLDKT